MPSQDREPGRDNVLEADYSSTYFPKSNKKPVLIATCKETLSLLKDIGTRTIIASGNKRARANLFQNISMAMIRGNIINVKSTLPPLNKNQEFLFLN